MRGGRREGKGEEGSKGGKDKLVIQKRLVLLSMLQLGLRMLGTGTCKRAHIMFGLVDSLWLLT